MLEEETHHFKVGNMPFTWKIDHFLGIYEGWCPLDMLGERHVLGIYEGWIPLVHV
jgi:hypothetical protein